MRKVAVFTALALVLTAATASAWSEPVTVAGVAKRLRARLQEVFKCENLQVSVVPYADARRTAKAEFHTVTVRADSATRRGITMRPLYVKGQDVVFDAKKLYGDPSVVETVRRGKTEMHVELTEKDMTSGLRLAQDAVPNISVSLQGGLITLTGTYKLLVGNKFKMAGKLQCKDGYHINFVPTAAKVNGVPIPVSGVKVLLSKLNPLLDLSEVVMKPKIKTITVDKGKLVVGS